MGLASEVELAVTSVIDTALQDRKGQVVPETENVALLTGAVELDATYLYADMADSSGLAQNYNKWFAAKVVRCYVNAATRMIKGYGGHIRSFDGDRVMGIFIGNTKSNTAARCALAISWAVTDVIRPKLDAKWPDVEWKMSHGVGIDTGVAWLVRGGVRNDNDLVAIGSAPNVAAKLSEQRQATINVTQAVHDVLTDDNRLGPNGVSMWQKGRSVGVGGKDFQSYTSNWQWGPP